MKPVQECWKAAAPELLAADAAAIDQAGARRIFFVGALCLWQLQQGYKNLPVPDMAQFEASLQQELLMFRATVGTPLEGKV